MGNQTNLNIRTDADIKASAERIFEQLGLNMSTAVNIFLRQAIRMQAIPFAISRGITNRSTLAAMREAERIADDPSVPAYSTRDSLARSLEA